MGYLLNGYDGWLDSPFQNDMDARVDECGEDDGDTLDPDDDDDEEEEDN